MTAKGLLRFAAPIQFGARESRLLLHYTSIEGDPTQRSRSESAPAAAEFGQVTVVPNSTDWDFHQAPHY